MNELTRATEAPKPRGAAEITAHVISVWFGCGHVPRIPGTAGTLGAIPLYLALRSVGLHAVALGAVLVTLVGLWSASRVCARLGASDPQIVCVDEVAGVLFAWLGAPAGTVGTIAGFVLFRLFDQLKPWPANVIERELPGGVGVMLDDVVAGIWAAALLALATRVGWL